MSDRKLAEFNFKVLHLILTCVLNLKRWGKGDNDVQTTVWNLIGHIFNLNISLKDISITEM